MGNESAPGKHKDEHSGFKLQEDRVRSGLAPAEVEEAIRQNALTEPPVLLITDQPDITNPSRKIIHFFHLAVDPTEVTEE